MRLSACLVIFGFLGVLAGGMAACHDESAASDAAAVREGAAQLNALAAEESRPAAALPSDACTGVSAGDIARVEARMKELNRDFVVLDAADLRVLNCSRAGR